MPKQKSLKKQYRLVPELVPSDLWGRSASKMLKDKAAWKKQIRPDAIAKAGDKCEICGADGKLVCHDKWNYDDKKLLATLTGFEIHCSNCDLVAHYKRMMQILGPNEVLRRAVPHLCEVNECSEREAIATLMAASDQWELRTAKKWSIAVAPELQKRYQVLAGLPTFTPAKIQD